MKNQMSAIPVSIIVVTRNEEARLVACLEALSGFDDIIVVDSASADRTAIIAQNMGARVVNFEWNGCYPKKYGWCLEHAPARYDWILFIDADEIMSPALRDEIAACDFKAAGYFIKGRYVIKGKALRCGMHNNKLCLLHRKKFVFPIIDDLDIPGMGEIEGHYQPVLKQEYADQSIGQMHNHVAHVIEDWGAWYRKHGAYAGWEAVMNARRSWPQENKKSRKILKNVFRAMPCRGGVAFLHSYIFKFGFMDGRAGYDFARARGWYYVEISRQERSRQ